MAAIEKAHREDQAKLAAIQKAHREEQAKLSQHIQQIQKQNASLQNEKGKMTGKIEQLETQLQQGKLCYIL